MQATLKDIAERAKVSTSLVSHALNNKPYARVSPQTKQRIQRIARELNYQPNAVARGLASKRMNTVGVVLMEGWRSPLNSPYCAAVVDGILGAASDAHQNVLFAPSQTRTDVTGSITAYRDGRCDGLLICAQPVGSTFVETLLEANAPFVLISDTYGDDRVSSVDVDNTGAYAEMVDYLLRQGHRRIAYLGLEIVHSSAARLAGYRLALETWKIEADPELVLSGSFEAEAVAKQVSRVMRLPDDRRPTALCCYNDDMALNAISALAASGLRVPQDVSVTGFDDIPAAGNHGLTTIRQPLTKIGECALERLLGLIRGVESATGRVQLPVQMIVRDSVAGPRPA